MPQLMAGPKDPPGEVVRRNLVRFREAVGLSQAQAAEQSGVPVYNLVRYENGKTQKVPHTVLAQLAPVYGHTTDHFSLEKPPPANVSDRPIVYYKVAPGEHIDDDIRAQIEREMMKWNKELRFRRKK
jgi:transcriptional regulator with XRE-family HTH domain